MNTRTIAIKHNRPVSYSRRFGSKFMRGGYYRQLVLAHYHRHMVYVNICVIDDVFPYDSVRRAASIA